jgi:hypothetical protein
LHTVNINSIIRISELLDVQSKESSIKFSWASSRVSWLNGEQTDILRTISVLVIREPSQVPDDKDRDGSWNGGLLAIWPADAAASLK